MCYTPAEPLALSKAAKISIARELYRAPYSVA